MLSGADFCSTVPWALPRSQSVCVQQLKLLSAAPGLRNLSILQHKCAALPFTEILLSFTAFH